MTLANKIDFCGIIVAKECNPNADPINGKRPRQDLEGHGIITDVALKRKIRDRLSELGQDILVISRENVTDGLYSVKARVDKEKELAKLAKDNDMTGFLSYVCKKWIDVRSFGQIFAYNGEKKGASVSASTRGPVSIGLARSIEPINIAELCITKSINNVENQQKRDSTTIGYRYIIDHGVYVFFGGIYPQLAGKTSFSKEDGELIKDAILTMFQNDSSAARPAGSMTLDKLFWWKHNCPNGQYSPAKIFQSLQLTSAENYPYYEYSINTFPDLEPEIIDGW